MALDALNLNIPQLSLSFTQRLETNPWEHLETEKIIFQLGTKPISHFLSVHLLTKLILQEVSQNREKKLK